MERMYYYLDKDNRQTGPLSWNELQALHLPGSTLVWYEGLSSWVRLSSLATRTTEPRKGFFRNLTPLRIVLLVYAVLGTLLMLAVGRFLFAFLSSYTYRHVDELPWCVFLLAVVLFIPFLFIKRRRYAVHAVLALLPWWIGSLASGVYYKVLCEASSYNEAYCRIKKPGQGWGIIDRWGMEVVPCVYEKVAYDDYFNPRYFLVVSDGRMGVYDLEGNTVVPCEWKQVAPCRGKSLVAADHDDFWRVADDDGLWGVITSEGEVLLPCKYSEINDWSDESDLLEVRSGETFGLFSPGGYEWVLSHAYLRKPKKVRGCAEVNLGGYVNDDGEIVGGEWGVVDGKGNQIVPVLFERLVFGEDEIVGFGWGGVHYYDYEGNRLRSE